MSYGSPLHLGVSAGIMTSSQSPLPGKQCLNVLSSSRCCDTTADAAALSVRACQLKSQEAFLERLPRLPADAMYSPTPSPYQQAHLLAAADTSAFYPMASLPGVERLTEGMKSATPGGHSPYYLDGFLAAHSYGSFYPGLDLNSAARRKNATRETTSALKAWLYEHRKNPYPTKGEKIMLAIITRMTLTQVSTWFANARRRLKKENKFGWTSKDDDDSGDEISISDHGDKQEAEDTMAEHCLSSPSQSGDEDEILKVSSDLSDISDAEDDNDSNDSKVVSPKKHDVTKSPYLSSRSIEKTISLNEHSKTLQSDQRTHDVLHNSGFTNRTNVSENKITTNRIHTAPVAAPPVPRPKIWSISEIIGSGDQPRDLTSEQSTSNKSHSFTKASS